MILLFLLTIVLFIGGILAAFKEGADEGICKYDYIGGDEE